MLVDLEVKEFPEHHPPPEKTVLALARYRYSGAVTFCRAEYVSRYAKECDGWDDSDVSVYDDDTDTYYYEEGWYEYHIGESSDGFGATMIDSSECQIIGWIEV